MSIQNCMHVDRYHFSPMIILAPIKILYIYVQVKDLVHIFLLNDKKSEERSRIQHLIDDLTINTNLKKCNRIHKSKHALLSHVSYIHLKCNGIFREPSPHLTDQLCYFSKSSNYFN